MKDLYTYLLKEKESNPFRDLFNMFLILMLGSGLIVALISVLFMVA